MNKFLKSFEKFFSGVFPHIKNKEAKQDIQRVYYAGALDVLLLLTKTSDGPDEEKEIIALYEEVASWCHNESERLMRESQRKGN